MEVASGGFFTEPRGHVISSIYRRISVTYGWQISRASWLYLDGVTICWLISSDICPWTLSVPRGSQFSSSFALGKLFASRNRYYYSFKIFSRFWLVKTTRIHGTKNRLYRASNVWSKVLQRPPLHEFDDFWRASKIIFESAFATQIKGGKGRFYSPVNACEMRIKGVPLIRLCLLSKAGQSCK